MELMTRTQWIAAVVLIAGVNIALAQSAGSVVGTIGEIRPETLEMTVKPDSGPAVAVMFTPDTVFQRVAPGEKDLKNAAAITAADLTPGDRVLVTFRPGSAEARRIIVMPASEIARRNEADRQDWIRRGVAGVVASKSGDQITLRMRSFQGESQATVTVGEKTTYRRYAPDSVKFADARPSNIAEINVGDQLRARGQKSEDGLKVNADEVVFGTFLTKAGTVTAVDLASGAITVKDLETNKPFTVKLTADSQLKRMPSFGNGAMPGRAPGDFGAGIARTGGQNGPGPTPGRDFPGGGPGARQGGDLSQMLERMPAAKLEDLKAGETIVVSSTRGASKDSITAIMLLANADMLIRMAAAQSSRNRPTDLNAGATGIGMNGLNGLEMPGMIP